MQLNTLILVSKIDNFTELKNKLILENSKVFSFNIFSHKRLEEEKINHEIAENYLDLNDRKKIFSLTVSLYNWYNNSNIGKIEFEGVNLLSLLDTAELHHLLMSQILNFLIIKRLIEKLKPDKIILTNDLSKIIEPMLDQKIKLELLNGNDATLLPWDAIQLKFNIFNIPISFNISRKKYKKIKLIFESLFGTLLDVSYKKSKENKTILLLEFDPTVYENLLTELNKKDFKILFFNQRRSALWNIKSIKILKQNNCKIINHDSFLTKSEKIRIKNLTKKYVDQLEIIFSDKNLFNKIFTIENVSFWSSIEDILFNTYKKRLEEYLQTIVVSRKVINISNPKCFLSLNVVGETEKIILSSNSNTPFVMLEHGYANHIPETSQYDIFHMYSLLKDRIAVWGNVQKNYLIEKKYFSEKNICVTGSPRHDVFFNRNKIEHQNKQKIILLTPHPINNLSGIADTNLYLRFEYFITNLFTSIKQISNVKIVIKLHPGQDEYSKLMIMLFKKFNLDVEIHHLTPIIDLLSKCDILVNISPESFDTSTVILESLIMKIPTINVILDDQNYHFSFVKDDAVLTISDKSNLDENLNKILFDKKTRENLQTSGEKHLLNYLSNPGSASFSLVEYVETLITENE